MKNSVILFLIVLLSLTAFAQKPKSVKKNTSATSKTLGDEKTELEKAVSITNAGERIAALQSFIKSFPKSKEKNRALELIVGARAAIADEQLRLGETSSGVELFNLALKEAPKPISDKLFTEVVLQIPTNLFFRGQQAAALAAAKTIEEKVEDNGKQILGLATFYLGTENALEARRLAEKAIQLEPNSASAYQTMGLAYRLNFQLEEAANAYAKALELDAGSVVSKRSLAEMKRAVGKIDEAAALYREILAENPADAAAQTGLALSLLNAEKRADAEAEMQKALGQTPNNLPLLVGAAYWYAAHEQGAKAIELAERAIAVEPRYTWAHIALARGLMLEKRPLEAERALLTARQYGNFPTLDYELAAARFQAGFFREAADDLKKTFVVKKGTIETRLGGRVPVEAKNFVDLLALERRAAIFEPASADNHEAAQKLKSLLDFSQKLDAAESNETAASEAADEFVKGEDKMKLHRQLYAANRLLEKRIALPKVLELAKSAVAQVDSAIEVPNPAAAVLAEELYESRALALTRGELVIVPNVPRQTLSSILRGRIEDISGWALFQENKPDEAVVRLKRAVSVLPEKSAWWRSSLWRLGAALDADGKSKEALEAYIKSYTNNPAPDAAKRIIIEAAYQKVYGNTEGLDQKIGAKPDATDAQTSNRAETAVQTVEKANPASDVEVKSDSVAHLPVTKEETQTVAEPKPTPKIDSDPGEAKKQEPETAPEKEETRERNVPETSPPGAETEIKQTDVKQTETAKNQTPEKTSTEKSLFEPVVITVPKVEEAKKKHTEAKALTEEKPSDNERDARNSTRERIAAEAKNVTEANAPAKNIEPCKIAVSQEIVSILSGGGSLGVLLTIEGAEDSEEIRAVSSSPADVEAILQPKIAALSNQALFVVKSISQNKGEYTIAFEALCGKREISVNVR